MNENEKVIAALGMGDGREAKESDLQALLEKSQHTADVWSGRAKKLAEEKAALEAELRRVRSGQAVKDATESLTEADLGDTPKDFVETSGKVAAKLVEQAEGRQSEEIRKLREEIAARDSNAFLAAIGAANRKFFSDIAPGGDKAELWARFTDSNRETLAAIVQGHDVARFNRQVEAFYREIGVPNPSGGEGASAAPAPREIGGANGGTAADAAGERTYTTQEYLEALDRAETGFRANGDRKAYDAATSLLNKALAEGRVK